VDTDPGKAGFTPASVAEGLPVLLGLAHLDVRGLMTIGRLAATPDEARSTFRRLRELSTRLRAAHPRLGPELSMGMSDDFEVAIEEGATIVRVGRALFGERRAAGVADPADAVPGPDPGVDRAAAAAGPDHPAE
jgi:uncharacterized pyridoxal phosphate-containing UPF0001 family protein